MLPIEVLAEEQERNEGEGYCEQWPDSPPRTNTPTQLVPDDGEHAKGIRIRLILGLELNHVLLGHNARRHSQRMNMTTSGR